MRSSTLLVAAALLCQMPGRARAEATHQPPVQLAQTAGSGSNSPGSMSGPKTEAAPGSLDGSSAAGKRTSKDNDTGNPLAGDEMNDRRPNADPRLGGTMPRPSPGAPGR